MARLCIENVPVLILIALLLSPSYTPTFSTEEMDVGRASVGQQSVERADHFNFNYYVQLGRERSGQLLLHCVGTLISYR